MQTKRFLSLRVQIVLAVLLGLLAGAAAAALTFLCLTAPMERTEGRLYWAAVVTSLAVGCLTMVLAVIVFHGKLEQDVLRLSSEISKIGAGDLEQHVTIRGCSEMTQLQRSVDEMRRSLQEKIQNEERAWQSNRDLITSLSHDLRSPLTAMIGYLELIRGGQSDGETQQYADACMAKALQLKTMSDELFRYFLVYDEAKLNLRPEVYDASALLGQMLGEQVLLAQEQGLRFRLSMPQKLGQIEADPQFLQRLFDNLFSNLQKYADPERDISISVTRPAGTLQIVFHNTIRELPEKPESSGIGLASCQRIVQAMNGTIQSGVQRNIYTTTIRLPGMEKTVSSK